LAQCGQVVDAYSMIVTGASSLPSTFSPSGLGIMRSAATGGATPRQAFQYIQPVTPATTATTTATPAIMKFRVFKLSAPSIELIPDAGQLEAPNVALPRRFAKGS
jgi:hypothetical protein